ncbi:zinc-binding protein [Pseudomonas fluorescens HK44]|uniref:Zinc-binding protein n=1 Tax=Pseudomonas fluorescens HK44 TaxID=1042209 RepID=A0A010SP85_PSEFL|nr:putative zinc-binding protein [Pseudomonas fluorescens]EXF92903.1 zinc-binding protein [Pseudomonas fluorescens HK44]
MPDSTLPLVYSCSGCSNVAQLANTLAVRLDRTGLAEMSCIVGVGGYVPALVNKARSGRRILALDGCPLQCVEGCLNQHGLHADVHLILSQHGLRKRYGEDCTEEQSDELFEEIKQLIGDGDLQEENRLIEATETA